MRCVAIWTILALACGCGSSTPPPTPPPQPALTAVADPGLRKMLLDAATSQVCTKTLGKFIGLPSSEDTSLTGTAAGMSRAAGRWLIDECQHDVIGGELVIQLTGPGWSWVDQEEHGFRVRQYVYFRARAYVRGTLNLAPYDANAHLATVWLTPTSAPAASFVPLSGINAQPTSVLAKVIGFVASGPIDAHAAVLAGQIGGDRLVEALSKGATITYSTATGQMDLLLGQLSPGQVPRRPFPFPAWLLNERQQLHAGGLQIAGPFPYVPNALLNVYIEPPGGTFSFGVMCAQSAATIVRQLANGIPLPPNAAMPASAVQAGQLYRVPLTPPSCDWVLVTYSTADTTTVDIGIPDPRAG